MLAITYNVDTGKCSLPAQVTLKTHAEWPVTLTLSRAVTASNLALSLGDEARTPLAVAPELAQVGSTTKYQGVLDLRDQRLVDYLADLPTSKQRSATLYIELLGTIDSRETKAPDFPVTVEGAITTGAPVSVELDEFYTKAETDTLLAGKATASLATTTASGQMAASDKVKLNGIAAGATVNAADSYLLDRANHTGTQAQSTVIGLSVALANKEAAGAAAAAQAAAVQRANHTGTQSADTLTDGTTNKAFTATERTKLAGVTPGATANDTDANLKNRANHTGSQAIGTITGLQAALDGKAAATAGVPSGGTNGQVLTKVSGAPAWADTSSGGGGAAVQVVSGVLTANEPALAGSPAAGSINFAGLSVGEGSILTFTLDGNSISFEFDSDYSYAAAQSIYVGSFDNPGNVAVATANTLGGAFGVAGFQVTVALNDTQVVFQTVQVGGGVHLTATLDGNTVLDVSGTAGASATGTKAVELAPATTGKKHTLTNLVTTPAAGSSPWNAARIEVGYWDGATFTPVLTTIVPAGGLAFGNGVEVTSVATLTNPPTGQALVARKTLDDDIGGDVTVIAMVATA